MILWRFCLSIDVSSGNWKQILLFLLLVAYHILEVIVPDFTTISPFDAQPVQLLPDFASGVPLLQGIALPRSLAEKKKKKKSDESRSLPLRTDQNDNSTTTNDNNQTDNAMLAIPFPEFMRLAAEAVPALIERTNDEKEELTLRIYSGALLFTLLAHIPVEVHLFKASITLRDVPFVPNIVCVNIVVCDVPHSFSFRILDSCCISVSSHLGVQCAVCACCVGTSMLWSYSCHVV